MVVFEVFNCFNCFKSLFMVCAIGVITSVVLLADLLLYGEYGFLWFCVGLALFRGKSLTKCSSPPHL